MAVERSQTYDCSLLNVDDDFDVLPCQSHAPTWPIVGNQVHHLLKVQRSFQLTLTIPPVLLLPSFAALVRVARVVYFCGLHQEPPGSVVAARVHGAAGRLPASVGAALCWGALAPRGGTFTRASARVGPVRLQHGSGGDFHHENVPAVQPLARLGVLP